MERTYRLFLSSPSDVAVERGIADRVVKRLNADLDDASIEIILWEDHFYTADSTFQDQIAKPSECDVVVCIFWKRLGSELPESYMREDGSIPTGSEFEFEDALHRATESSPKTPDVLVYRKTAPVTFQEDNLVFEKAQRDSFLSFWERWFHSEKGHFVAGFQSFETTEDFEPLFEKHLRAWIKSRQPAVDGFKGSPFRGLESYSIEDADCFFGRDRETQRARARFIVNAASGHPVLFLTGTSGSGKSSLIRAGVLANLRKSGSIPTIADDVCIAVETPASLIRSGDWANGLATSLLGVQSLGAELANSDFGTAQALAELLRNSPASVASVICRALDRASASKGNGHRMTLLLTIDQLEEVFNYPADERTSFAKCLSGLLAHANTERPQVGLIFGMRSDFRHLLNGNPELADLAGLSDVKGPNETERLLEIAHPKPGDLRDIILGPAKLAGLTYETQQNPARQLADEIEEQASRNSLPALQLLLTELYQHRDDTLLTLAAMDGLGGLGGVVAKVAEAEFEAMPASVQAALPRILRAFSVQDPENNKTLARRLPSDTFEKGTLEYDLVQRFSDRRLIVNDGETMRIAHESLLADWPRAAEIIEHNRRFSALRDRLGQRAIAFDTAPTADAKQMYLTGFDLNEGRELLMRWGAEELSDTHPTLPTFLQASIKANRRKKLSRIVAGVSVCAVVLAAAVWAWMFNLRAQEADKRAAISFQLAKAGIDLRMGDELSAISAALAATNIEDSIDTRNALAEALSELSPFHKATFAAANQLVLWQDENALQLFGTSEIKTVDVQSQLVSTQVLLESNQPLIAAHPTSDAGWLGVATDGTILDDKGQSFPFEQDEVDLVRAAQADIKQLDDGTYLIAFADDFAGAWVVRCNAAVALRCETVNVLGGQATAVSWSNDNPKLAVAYVDENNAPVAAVFERSTLFTDQATAISETHGDVGDVWLSIQWLTEEKFALAARSGALTLSTPEGGTETIPLGNLPISAQDWSATRQMLATNCHALLICLFDEHGREVARLSGHSQVILDLAFSPDGRMLASKGDNNETILWTIDQNQEFMSLLQSGGKVQTTAFTTQGGQVAYGDTTGTVFTGATTAHPFFQLKSNRSVAFLALSETNAMAVSDRNGGLAIWHAAFPMTEPDLWLPEQDAQRLAWLANGDLAFTTRAGEVGTIRLADRSNRVTVVSVPQRADGITALGVDAFATSHTGGGIYIWSNDGPKEGRLLNGNSLQEGDFSAFSMSATPSGEWLVATRGDSKVKLYNLSDPEKEASVGILRPNSKASLFSPLGAQLAVLDADGMLYIWDFDATTGWLDQKFVLRMLPKQIDPDGNKRIVGIGWLDENSLAASVDDGTIYRLEVRPEQHRDWASKVVKSAER
ncbi:NACHT and WD repeat domain-containing protein [Sulfitobacter donghicola]|uniref:Novel STAND NTPase 1 domain-containing protein n=1 Tax=Sulfitobacter donghicola DSW-25 = KCTC 12864 = JCM 14565 TaxID=1300350 RepID=A0A073IWB1_9RHOB|nr:NACHT and WD repeat domain-containing protein [Sulfitobacter donghicola]KEJ89662.1 hypothetical protein DSW25_11150 [Sulfitobacter donghicola DSW-25 = KCTC 12864 = JCM 14565]KIN69378.1 WD40 repeat-containing protein [Sulfitobacter donghicola DSW-25 = KCTC 12864 = JCM 14565]